MRLRLAVPLILMATAAVTAFASCAKAGAGTPDGVPDDMTIVTERLADDSARLIARWSPACDAKGCADGYATQWLVGAATVRTALVTGTADTTRVKLAAYGDSIRITFGVTTRRRGRIGPAKSVSLWLRNEDAAPPGVDSVKVDTSGVSAVDSSRFEVYDLDGRRVAGAALTLVERDSVLLVHRVYLKPGRARPLGYRARYTVEQDAALLALRPVGTSGDSAWLVALSCGCRESGDRDNPPTYLPGGGYHVRTASGAWRPVTPAVGEP